MASVINVEASDSWVSFSANELYHWLYSGNVLNYDLKNRNNLKLYRRCKATAIVLWYMIVSDIAHATLDLIKGLIPWLICLYGYIDYILDNLINLVMILNRYIWNFTSRSYHNRRVSEWSLGLFCHNPGRELPFAWFSQRLIHCLYDYIEYI